MVSKLQKIDKKFIVGGIPIKNELIGKWIVTCDVCNLNRPFIDYENAKMCAKAHDLSPETASVGCINRQKDNEIEKNKFIRTPKRPKNRHDYKCFFCGREMNFIIRVKNPLADLTTFSSWKKRDSWLYVCLPCKKRFFN